MFVTLSFYLRARVTLAFGLGVFSACIAPGAADEASDGIGEAKAYATGPLALAAQLDLQNPGGGRGTNRPYYPLQLGIDTRMKGAVSMNVRDGSFALIRGILTSKGLESNCMRLRMYLRVVETPERCSPVYQGNKVRPAQVGGPLIELEVTAQDGALSQANSMNREAIDAWPQRILGWLKRPDFYVFWADPLLRKATRFELKAQAPPWLIYADPARAETEGPSAYAEHLRALWEANNENAPRAAMYLMTRLDLVEEQFPVMLAVEAEADQCGERPTARWRTVDEARYALAWGKQDWSRVPWPDETEAPLNLGTWVDWPPFIFSGQ